MRELLTSRSSSRLHKLAVYVALLGDRTSHEQFLREVPNFFSTMEDFLWFKLAIIREAASVNSSVDIVRYTLLDLQTYLNSFKREHYSKGGKEPLLFVQVLLLSLQFRSAVNFLCSLEVRNPCSSLESKALVC